MASDMRLVDIMSAVTKISKKVQPMLRIGCSVRELYDAIFGCLAEAPTVEPTQEWFPTADPPKKQGKYLIYTTQYFTPDHVDDIDHVDGIEISGYHPLYGFLSTNGLHAKYWTYLPADPKEVTTDGSNRNS